MDFFTKKVSAAVTGLESKLDSVLLGDNNANNNNVDSSTSAAGDSEKKDATATTATTSSTTQQAPSKSAGIPARVATPPISGSTTGKLTMQERLAAAMARSASPGAGMRGGSALSAASPAQSTRSSMDVTREKVENEGVVERKEVDNAAGRPSEQPINGVQNEKTKAGVAEEAAAGEEEKMDNVIKDDKDSKATEGASSAEGRPGKEQPGFLGDTGKSNLSDTPSKTTDSANNKNSELLVSSIPSISIADAQQPSESEYQTIISQLQADLALCEARRQEESHAASERIDALEEKLKYLARESAEASRHRATNTPVGGVEKKLAEKEERIVLLLEEGERLSKLELKNMTLIKKLRARAAEEEKATVEVKKKLEKSEKETADAKGKLKKAAETEKRLNERIKSFGRLESEVEMLRRENSDKESQLLDLKSQLESEKARAESAESRVQTDALEAEKKLTADLRQQLDRLQTEAALIEENLRSEMKDLKAKMERDQERAQMMEAELKTELSVTESKMEVLRARAEEVSSGAAGDAHAKLLRQVETLQTQYAIASENWQGIEGSLLARVTALEKERNELAQKEADTRRKARESNLKARQAAGDLQYLNGRVKDLEEDLESRSQKIDSLRQEILKLEASMKSLQETLTTQRDKFETELAAKIEEGKNTWMESMTRRSPSPDQPMHRSPTIPTDSLGFLPYPNSLSRRELSRSPSAEPTSDSHARAYRSRPSFSSPIGQDSSLSLPHFVHPMHNNSSRSSLPLVNPSNASMVDEEESYFVGNRNLDHSHAGMPSTPISPQARHFSHDLVSASTVAAGPSVQLVERMSATVRRLETEKAASKEELARMSGQRDEARQEIVELMREVEQKRKIEERCKALEEEISELNERQETTLELLGEKTEEVEELRADVADLKQMMKDLMSSMK